jgi:hypothetical protein
MYSPNAPRTPGGNQGSDNLKGNTPGSNKSKDSQNRSQPNTPQNKDKTGNKESTPKSADPGPGFFRFHSLEGLILAQNSHRKDSDDPNVGNALWHLKAQPRERPGPLLGTSYPFLLLHIVYPAIVHPSNDAPMSLRPAPPQASKHFDSIPS